MRTLASRTLPPHADLGLDPGAVVVTALVAIATGVLFGLFLVYAGSGYGVYAMRWMKQRRRGTSPAAPEPAGDGGDEADTAQK